MDWLEVSIRTDAETAEFLAEALRPFGQGEAVAIEQHGDPNNLDPAALLPDVYVKIFVSSPQDTPEFRLQIIAIASIFNTESPRFLPLAEADWAEAWKAHYRPFPIGHRFWIKPSWEMQATHPPGKIVLTLDPGMAFGTGLHETTQLCLEALERLVKPGMRVLDLGTGSGILAIAAARLGAARVDAVDNDPVAIEAARSNAALNGVTSQLAFYVGSLEELPPRSYDLVLVNILAAIIIPMLEDGSLMVAAALEGFFVFSGIIERQQEEFASALTAAGGRPLEVLHKGDWIAVIGQRK